MNINGTKKKIDIILSPAMGGVIIGYEIGRILKKETIFCEREKGKFKLRRGFNIKAKSKVLIIEDVITTGKSSLECVKLIKSCKASLAGFACIIDRSNKSQLKIKNKIIFISNSDGDNDIYSMTPSDGSNQKRLTETSQNETEIFW